MNYNSSPVQEAYAMHTDSSEHTSDVPWRVDLHIPESLCNAHRQMHNTGVMFLEEWICTHQEAYAMHTDSSEHTRQTPTNCTFLLHSVQIEWYLYRWGSFSALKISNFLNDSNRQLLTQLNILWCVRFRGSFACKVLQRCYSSEIMGAVSLSVTPPLHKTTQAVQSAAQREVLAWLPMLQGSITFLLLSIYYSQFTN
jgi:hypothetical protein